MRAGMEPLQCRQPIRQQVSRSQQQNVVVRRLLPKTFRNPNRRTIVGWSREIGEGALSEERDVLLPSAQRVRAPGIGQHDLQRRVLVDAYPSKLQVGNVRRLPVVLPDRIDGLVQPSGILSHEIAQRLLRPVRDVMLGPVLVEVPGELLQQADDGIGSARVARFTQTSYLVPKVHREQAAHLQLVGTEHLIGTGRLGKGLAQPIPGPVLVESIVAGKVSRRRHDRRG